MSSGTPGKATRQGGNCHPVPLKMLSGRWEIVTRYPEHGIPAGGSWHPVPPEKQPGRWETVIRYPRNCYPAGG
ncbi:MAG TPA: hypothetical protein VHO70_17950 [Chitinispirillaceae bacterium]|nr:hypothetical protein [Chitinispirillaceae bacterium]